MLEKVEIITKQMEELLRGARISSSALEKLQQDSQIVFDWAYISYSNLDKNNMCSNEEEIKQATNIAIKLHNKGPFKNSS